MKTKYANLLIFLIMLGGLGAWGCTGGTDNRTSPQSDADSDSDSDSDSDADSDSDEVPTNVDIASYKIFGDYWWGYAFVELSRESDEISPEDFDDIGKNDKLCIEGEVGEDGRDAYGMIGINIRQAPKEGSEPKAVPLVGDGITVDLELLQIPSVLRIILHGPREPGDTDPNNHDTWCVPVMGYGGTYRWSDFTTRCYNNQEPGDPYNGEDIQFISITSPGNNSATPFGFCINKFELEDDLVEEVVDLYPEKDGEICLNTGSSHVYTQDPEAAYLLTNNVWASSGGAQCLTFDNNAFEITTQTNQGNTSGAPASFPSIIYGTKSSSENSKFTLLPKKVSELGKVTTHWSQNAPNQSGAYNAAYDVWFNTSEDSISEVSNQSDLPTAAYLMVWYHYQGNINPIASDTGKDVTIAGKSWRVWTGSPGPSGAKHIAYVATGRSSLTFDLKDFIDDAVERGVVSQSHYLAAIQAGFEIWSGGEGLETTDFWVDEDTI